METLKKQVENELNRDKSFVCISLYHLLEILDGETRQVKLVPYKTAQRIKIYLMEGIK